MTDNTIKLAGSLIKKTSITPDDAGCMDEIQKILTQASFSIRELNFEGCRNMLALHGNGKPFILFLGHTDVVPTGDRSLWDHDPFLGEIISCRGIDMLYGRGSADMKGSDAAMTMAVHDYVRENPAHNGTIGLLLTSNEEGDGKGGIRNVAMMLDKENLIPEYCIVGEPSSEEVFGDTIKVGRRGSLSILVTVHGIQGHAAYPDKVDNPIHKAALLIERMTRPLDKGTDAFEPTSFEVTNIRAGTGSENTVPAKAEFLCNYRFNPLQTPQSIKNVIEGYLKELNIRADLNLRLNGVPFETGDSDDPKSHESILKTSLMEAVFEVTGINPKFSTSGGTSDGRFIAPYGAKVVEFGPRSHTIHQANECVAAQDLESLKKIYQLTIAKILIRQQQVSAAF